MFAGVIGCGYFCPSRFSDDVVQTTVELVKATRILWQLTKVGSGTSQGRADK